MLAPSPSPYGFVALDRDPGVPGVDSLYVADDSGSPNGGIVKFSFDGTTWTPRGSFRPGGSAVRGLTGAVTPSGVTLYATTSAANELVAVIDSAAFDATIAATSTTLANAAANTVFRGVAFAPSGGGGGGDVAPTIGTQPQDSTIVSGATATLTVAAAGTGPLSYQWYEGVAGDTSTPVGAGAASFTTPALTTTTSYWVRVTGPGGVVDSRTATVTVGCAARLHDRRGQRRLRAGHGRHLTRGRPDPCRCAAPWSPTTRARSRRCAASTSRTPATGMPPPRTASSCSTTAPTSSPTAMSCRSPVLSPSSKVRRS